MLILDWQRKLLYAPDIGEKSQAKEASVERNAAGGEPFWVSEEGATAIEYGLIDALIALACIIAFTSLELNLAVIFDAISSVLRLGRQVYLMNLLI